VTPVETTYKPAVLPTGIATVVTLAKTTVNSADVLDAVIVRAVHPHAEEADVNVLGQKFPAAGTVQPNVAALFPVAVAVIEVQPTPVAPTPVIVPVTVLAPRAVGKVIVVVEIDPQDGTVTNVEAIGKKTPVEAVHAEHVM